MLRILIINGPNLNLLGRREPEIYGEDTFEDFMIHLRGKYIDSDVDLTYFQSNHEGHILDKLHEVGFSYDGIVLNAGALTHTSIAIADAIAGIETPVIEVHISNVHKRETFRHHSYVSPVAEGIIVGFGLRGYELAVDYFL
ncbi:type II 3-dehydroquinate dehydratase [Neolewinella agarilytica]|uniref:3-dehydroquinate dehydratase n=1 Tax=Neolewinella agarilytica TaxID=478744 RepID=A0A1H9ILV3_9BACT|nr:type II 3-dehydroquinate dehydratase [Neolewinella agarilytica]SEQ75507.1 3-dehydroquinate dehydratase [Neolewinella agarilytica]